MMGLLTTFLLTWTFTKRLTSSIDDSAPVGRANENFAHWRRSGTPAHAGLSGRPRYLS